MSQKQCRAVTESKVINEKSVSLKRLFLEFLLSGGQTADLRSNLMAPFRKRVKGAIECVFGGAVALGSPAMCRFVENVEKAKFDL